MYNATIRCKSTITPINFGNFAKRSGRQFGSWGRTQLRSYKQGLVILKQLSMLRIYPNWEIRIPCVVTDKGSSLYVLRAETGWCFNQTIILFLYRMTAVSIGRWLHL